MPNEKMSEVTIRKRRLRAKAQNAAKTALHHLHHDEYMAIYTTIEEALEALDAEDPRRSEVAREDSSGDRREGEHGLTIREPRERSEPVNGPVRVEAPPSDHGVVEGERSTHEVRRRFKRRRGHHPVHTGAVAIE